jgi:spore coat protein SA
LAHFDAVCGVSDYIASGIARRFPAFAARCHAIHNGCDPDLFRLADSGGDRAASLREALGLGDRKIVTFVGRVTPEKGVHVLIEAMKTVLRGEPKAALLIVGAFSPNPPSPAWLSSGCDDFEAYKTDYEQQLRKAARPFGDAVRFAGRVPYAELAAYYAATDVLVHPAVWNEPFGMIITEAMACRRPVVSTRAGGIPEIVVDGETGLLAEPGDPVSLAERILEVLADRELALRMGERGRERVERMFTWEHTAAGFREVLASLS